MTPEQAEDLVTVIVDRADRYAHQLGIPLDDFLVRLDVRLDGTSDGRYITLSRDEEPDELAEARSRFRTSTEEDDDDGTG